MPDLFERDEQVAALQALFGAAAEGRGGCAFVDGPAGAGKTSLLERARADAELAGLRCLQARGAELEAAFAHGVIHQLLDGELRAREAFAGPAAPAAALLGADAAATAAPRDDFGARHALFWLVANLAATQPLALFVDDAHWSDDASLAALAHIANRLADLPVALVCAARSEESGSTLDALRALARPHLAVPPLGAAAAAALVRSLDPTADDARCAAAHEATGGNPFLLSELARGGELDGSPSRVTWEIGRRLERLPADARAVARAAALLGDVPLRQVAELAGLDGARSAAAADDLVTAGILRDVNPVRFLHPLVRAAVYAGIGPAQQGREHGRAARLLAAEGASGEHVAAQLLRCPPAGDEWVHAQLCRAAGIVGERGAFDAQATYLRRALAEPPPPEERAATLLALAAAETAGSTPNWAIPHLREALDGDLGVLERHAPAMTLANLLSHGGDTPAAVEVLEAQVAALADHPGLRAAAQTALVNVAAVHPRTRARTAPLRAELRRRADAGEDLEPGLMGAVAIDMMLAGEPAASCVERAEPALALLSGSGTSATDWSGMYAAFVLIVCGRYEPALRACDRAMAFAVQRGAILDRGAVLCFRADLHVRRGDLAAAELDSRALLQIADGYDWPLGEAYARGVLGEVLYEQGAIGEAEAMLRSGRFAGRREDILETSLVPAALSARARIALALGRTDEAIADAREAGRRQVALGVLNPNHVAWAPVLAEALHRAGAHEEAGAIADEDLVRARRAATPRGLGIALTTAAVVRPERAERLLREAVDVLSGAGAEVTLARAHVRLGSALRAGGAMDEAREELRLGVDLAHRCGAARLEEEAVAELRATGARPRRRATTGRDALTPSERRIADLAAAGRQNRDIADELFVTVSTVEFHLRNAYRKLGVRGRSELAGAR